MPLNVLSVARFADINGQGRFGKCRRTRECTEICSCSHISFAALVTPPDVITQVILFVVVYGLYEVSIFLVSRVEKKREEKLREEGFYDDEDDFDDPMLKEFDDDEKTDQLERIADALERFAPKTEDFPNFDNFSAFMWHVAPDYRACKNNERS